MLFANAKRFVCWGRLFIANVFNLELGETLDILTDGEKIVLKRTEITKL